jgi:hypothetical protein
LNYFNPGSTYGLEPIIINYTPTFGPYQLYLARFSKNLAAIRDILIRVGKILDSQDGFLILLRTLLGGVIGQGQV